MYGYVLLSSFTDIVLTAEVMWLQMRWEDDHELYVRMRSGSTSSN
jgi:hypothetical protein